MSTRNTHVRLVNLTGHSLKLASRGDEALYLPSEGRARVDSGMRMVDRFVVGMRIVIPLLEITENKIVDLPDPVEGIVYIVSGIVAGSVRDRDDVVTPSRVVRDDTSGRVTEARALLRVR